MFHAKARKREIKFDKYWHNVKEFIYTWDKSKLPMRISYMTAVTSPKLTLLSRVRGTNT